MRIKSKHLMKNWQSCLKWRIDMNNSLDFQQNWQSSHRTLCSTKHCKVLWNNVKPLIYPLNTMYPLETWCSIWCKLFKFCLNFLVLANLAWRSKSSFKEHSQTIQHVFNHFIETHSQIIFKWVPKISSEWVLIRPHSLFKLYFRSLASNGTSDYQTSLAEYLESMSLQNQENCPPVCTVWVLKLRMLWPNHPYSGCICPCKLQAASHSRHWNGGQEVWNVQLTLL